MPSVPDRFWLVAREPRPAPVTSVTPRRIYVSLDGVDVEIDRAAYVDSGEIRVIGPSVTAPVLAASRKDAARGSQQALHRELADAEVRVTDLRGDIRALKERLHLAKAERRRLRRELAAR